MSSHSQLPRLTERLYRSLIVHLHIHKPRHVILKITANITTAIIPPVENPLLSDEDDDESSETNNQVFSQDVKSKSVIARSYHNIQQTL